MGLYPQPNKWLCGPFALKYALIMLGRSVNEKEISRIAGTHWWGGTDDIKLARAARAYRCELRMVRRTSALRARRELLLSLKLGRPCILCVDKWNHWITVVGAERGKLISIDSREAPVVCIDEWKTLKRRWMFSEKDEDDPTQRKTLFDLHVLVPKFRVKSKARFSLKGARYLRRPENSTFATRWDEYFEDLSHICHPRTPRSERVFPMGELLRRHGTMLREQIAFWHGGVKPREVDRILRNIQFVADTYDLVVRKGDEKRAIVAISSILTLWASSKRGVGPVYGGR
jgi:hypothetical protein